MVKFDYTKCKSSKGRLPMHIIDFILSNQPYFENFISRATYHSNNIEGNTLSYAETYALLFNDNEFSVQAKPREIYEAINHKYALSYVMEQAKKQNQLSTDMMVRIAQLINRNIEDINGFRKHQVFLRGATHVPPKPEAIPSLMLYFIDNYHHTKDRSLSTKLARTHIEFERIHPFSDGNGRTGRLLINYELLKNNEVPIVIEKDFRTEYFNYLENQDIDGLAHFFDNLRGKEKDYIQEFGFQLESENDINHEI